MGRYRHIADPIVLQGRLSRVNTLHVPGGLGVCFCGGAVCVYLYVRPDCRQIKGATPCHCVVSRHGAWADPVTFLDGITAAMMEEGLAAGYFFN